MPIGRAAAALNISAGEEGKEAQLVEGDPQVLVEKPPKHHAEGDDNYIWCKGQTDRAYPIHVVDRCTASARRSVAWLIFSKLLEAKQNRA